nr:F-box domain, leucine-rich repeat domain, L domain-like protein [Tanacetum cinerariifolium]
MALIGTQIQNRYYNKPTINNLRVTSPPTAKNKRQDYLPHNEVVREGLIRLERADTRKQVAVADETCYKYVKQGRYFSNCPFRKVRNKAYFRENMFLAVKEENGQSLTIDENDFHIDTNDEGEQLKVTMVFMARLDKMEVFKFEHAGVTNALRDDSQLNEALLNKVHYETENELDSDQDRLIHGITSIVCHMTHIEK